MRYTMTLTEKQLSVIQIALEEYFRLRLGQTFDFADDLSSLGVDLSPENPKHNWLLDMHICNRDWIEQVMKGIFRTLWPVYGVPKEKTEEMLVAECIWDAIRVTRGISRYSKPMQIGTEPLPIITKETKDD